MPLLPIVILYSLCKTLLLWGTMYMIMCQHVWNHICSSKHNATRDVRACLWVCALCHICLHNHLQKPGSKWFNIFLDSNFSNGSNLMSGKMLTSRFISSSWPLLNIKQCLFKLRPFFVCVCGKYHIIISLTRLFGHVCMFPSNARPCVNIN